MESHGTRRVLAFISVVVLSLSLAVFALGSQDQSSSSGKHKKSSIMTPKPAIEDGAVINGVYRNKTLGLSCKIPAGWVLRTEDMNVQEEQPEATTPPEGAAASASSVGAKVLLAAFSRPPDARADDVNSSILIAAESEASYPGLKDAAQYFGPLTEVAKAQGFTVDEEPYGFAVGTKTLVRSDFHRNIGTRVMRQSTLAMLAHGYAVSITVIAGSEDEVEELIDGLSFGEARK